VVGIRERHVCSEEESAADLATAAGLRAIESAGIHARDLDLILLATDTPEYLSPATSVIVQQRLGAKNSGTFDINCACAGFVTALDTAAKYIKADEAYSRILVIGAYAMSKFLDWTDKKTATLFADGAGAVIVEASKDGPGVLASKLRADGEYHSYMGIYAGGSHMPITRQVLDEGKYNKLRFIQKYPAEINIEGWPLLIAEVLAKAGLTLDEVEVMNKMELPMSRTHTIMHKWGYTGSACVAMALDDAAKAGKLKRGQVVVLCASGGGLNMACVALRW
jgi:3-oxoacyl-[acyl-carrier-protein] synthase-3